MDISTCSCGPEGWLSIALCSIGILAWISDSLEVIVDTPAFVFKVADLISWRASVGACPGASALGRYAVLPAEQLGEETVRSEMGRCR
jgi:hypothetical protein